MRSCALIYDASRRVINLPLSKTDLPLAAAPEICVAHGMRISSSPTSFTGELASDAGLPDLNAALSGRTRFSSDPGPVIPFGGAPGLQERVASLGAGELLILLVAQEGDARNAVYDPVFGGFAASERRGHDYGRTVDPGIAALYGVTDFPAVLIFSAGREPYTVKDRTAVHKETGYFTLPVEKQLAHVEKRLNDRDAAKRGSAVLAYGLTARESDDDAVLTRAARELASMLGDKDPAVRAAAIYSCSLIADSLPPKASLVLLRALIPSFLEPGEAAFEAMALCRRFAEAPRFAATSKDLAPMTAMLRVLFACPDPDLASGAVVTYAAFLPFLPDAEVSAVLPTWDALFAAPNDILRWSAFYGYGEAFQRLSGERREFAEKAVLEFLSDPYAGIRHRALLILAENWGVFVPKRAEELAPTLRALYSEPAQQLDVAELSIRFYADMAPFLGEAELVRGSETLRKLRDDPEEHERVTQAAVIALEELKGK